MRTLMCALIGLIIYVSQPSTVILVENFAVQENEYYNHALSTAIISGGAGGSSLDRLLVLGEAGNIPKRRAAMPGQLVGPRRGPVK